MASNGTEVAPSFPLRVQPNIVPMPMQSMEGPAKCRFFIPSHATCWRLEGTGTGTLAGSTAPEKVLTTGSPLPLPWPEELLPSLSHAAVAQLVERDLPKVDVEGSSPFGRSNNEPLGHQMAEPVTSKSVVSNEPS